MVQYLSWVRGCVGLIGRLPGRKASPHPHTCLHVHESGYEFKCANNHPFVNPYPNPIWGEFARACVDEYPIADPHEETIIAPRPYGGAHEYCGQHCLITGFFIAEDRLRGWGQTLHLAKRGGNPADGHRRSCGYPILSQINHNWEVLLREANHAFGDYSFY